MSQSHTTYRTVIKPNYAALKAIYLTSRPMKDGRLVYGKTTVRVKGVDGFSTRGTVSRNCLLGGMSKLYSTFGLQKGDEITFEVGSRNQEQTLMIELPKSRLPSDQTSSNATPISPDQSTSGVFAQRNLESVPIHVLPPHDADDVMVAFIAQSSKTPFQFGRRMTEARAEELGFQSKGCLPHAICLDQETGQYHMTTFVVHSSEFKDRFHRDDSDILVCWDHDEQDHTHLPKTVIALESLATSSRSIM
jgi:hypothetical protein